MINLRTKIGRYWFLTIVDSIFAVLTIIGLLVLVVGWKWTLGIVSFSIIFFPATYFLSSLTVKWAEKGD
jgi:hypothetical protein